MLPQEQTGPCVVDLDVADVAGAAVDARGRPRRRRTMPQPMPVPILTKRKSSTERATPAVLLAERHDVDVVVDHHRAAELAG